MRAFSLGIIAVLSLAVSVGLKNKYEYDYVEIEKAEKIAFDPADYFSGTKFVFQAIPNISQYIGINGACFITVGVSNRDGDADAIFERTYASPGIKIWYLYKNSLSSEPRYLRAQFDHYVEMLKVAVGDKPTANLMMHIAAQSSCTLEDFAPLAWNS